MASVETVTTERVRKGGRGREQVRPEPEPRREDLARRCEVEGWENELVSERVVYIALRHKAGSMF